MINQILYIIIFVLSIGLIYMYIHRDDWRWGGKMGGKKTIDVWHEKYY